MYARAEHDGVIYVLNGSQFIRESDKLIPPAYIQLLLAKSLTPKLRQRVEARVQRLLTLKSRRDRKAVEKKFPDEHFEEETQQQRMRRIRATCEARGISTLLHFTCVSNLLSIKNRGLAAVSVLDKENVEFDRNDAERFDLLRSWISLSISFPNYKLFYKLQCDNPGKQFAVIAISSKILWELDCLFCPYNAAARSMVGLEKTILKHSECFEHLFYRKPAFSNISGDSHEIPQNYPTDPQAEVLVYKRIGLPYIQAVNFQSQNLAEKFATAIPEWSDRIKIAPAYFMPRKDFKMHQRRNRRF